MDGERALLNTIDILTVSSVPGAPDAFRLSETVLFSNEYWRTPLRRINEPCRRSLVNHSRTTI